MKKSGLADSPFFKPLTYKTEATPLSDTADSKSPSDNELLSPTPNVPGQETASSEKFTPNQTGNETEQAQKRTDVRTYERTDVRTQKKPIRRKIRHAFDIYEDQLQALQILQFEAVQKGKKKPKLGKMVQEAIDQYLKKLALK